MKNILLFAFLFITSGFAQTGFTPEKDRYIPNRAPLLKTEYIPLPLGAIKPHGWLRTMLELQRDGLTGNLDKVYEKVCGSRNGWLGGDGDVWERGPYWIDGLLPLAYILDDKALIEKTQKWVEWSIANQREDGYFGPYALPEDTPKEKGLQKDNAEDWWPKMVMLKVLQQYYMATGDTRVINLMTKYFHYQLAHLPEHPLDKWTFWAAERGADNLSVVHWLYNITGDAKLLTLGELIHKQTSDWKARYTEGEIRVANPFADLHCVNLSQGLKAPIVYFQQSKDSSYLNAVKEGLDALRDVHGFVTGVYGADETLHGNDPTQGSELCTAVEMMFSFETILPITGDVFYADYLEKIAFNVLPTQHNDDFTRRQYFQQTNQVLVNFDARNFNIDDYGRTVFGVTTGYPCCTCNMHQGWPKYVQNLWYGTTDGGIAALVYGAGEVNAFVNGGKVTCTEETNYPFSDEIRFTYKSVADLNSKPIETAFPMHLRIPAWCKEGIVTINGEEYGKFPGGQIVIINRTWKTGDAVLLKLPMAVALSRWFEGSVGIERGPLVYALKMNETWKEVKTDAWDDSYFEVTSESPWNYGILESAIEKVDFRFETKAGDVKMPWNTANAPVALKTDGKIIDSWQLYNGSAGKIPVQRWYSRNSENPVKEIELIPYGCTTLRIAEFPTVK